MYMSESESTWSQSQKSTADSAIDSRNRYQTQRDEAKSLYIFYTATTSPASGYSWCPMCVEVSELMEKYLNELHNSILLRVQVGSEEEWDDKSNPFRTDKNIELKLVPTLTKYKSQKRLQGHHCLNPKLLSLVFEEDCEFFD